MDTLQIFVRNNFRIHTISETDAWKGCHYIGSLNNNQRVGHIGGAVIRCSKQPPPELHMMFVTNHLTGMDGFYLDQRMWALPCWHHITGSACVCLISVENWQARWSNFLDVCRLPLAPLTKSSLLGTLGTRLDFQSLSLHRFAVHPWDWSWCFICGNMCFIPSDLEAADCLKALCPATAAVAEAPQRELREGTPWQWSSHSPSEGGLWLPGDESSSKKESNECAYVAEKKNIWSRVA